MHVNPLPEPAAVVTSITLTGTAVAVRQAVTANPATVAIKVFLMFFILICGLLLFFVSNSFNEPFTNELSASDFVTT